MHHTVYNTGQVPIVIVEWVLLSFTAEYAWFNITSAKLKRLTEC